jgi:hypothetical protein
MTNLPQKPPPEWDLGEWERVLTIHVGTVYACRVCENLVMVSKGGVGVMQLMCCGKAMVREVAGAAGGAR